jgi:alpha-tubulin suppressor-like RCC1 family protein
MALTATGELFVWGMGGSGQLGHGEARADLTVPRVVDEIDAVTGMAGGETHSLVTTLEGHVLAFGNNGEYEDFPAGEELDEPVFVVDGRLGLGAGVEEALTPTAIDGITVVGEREEGEEGKEGKE